MLCHLPVPYPDELLYSIIARHLIHVGASKSRGLISHLFGRNKCAQVDLPSSLSVVSERTWPIWQMTGEDIANRLTLFPFYSRYVKPVTARQALAKLLSSDGRSVHANLGIAFFSVKQPKYLRFCPSCRTTDMDTLGETYWRRSHQLPGVLACTEHGDRLINSTALLRPIGPSVYADATRNTLDATSTNENDLDQDAAIKAITIAKRCKDFLSGRVALWDKPDIILSYRESAVKHGFSKGHSLSRSKLKSAITEYYGESLLTHIGCQHWLTRGILARKMFTLSDEVMPHPVEHAMIQLFLEDNLVNGSEQYDLPSGPWRCPNPYAKHKDAFPIKNTVLYTNKHHQRIASARCACGFSFTFLQISDSDPQLPIVHRITEYGPAWEGKAAQLKKKGLSITDISAKLGVQHRTVKKLLDKKKSGHHISQEQINQWRKEWMDLLATVSEGSRKLARAKNETLYGRLRRNDRDWLYSIQRNKTYTTSRQRLDRNLRDKSLSEKLKTAGQEIMSTTPLRRASRNAIFRMAGLTPTLLGDLEHFPACHKVLSEYIESTDNYHERRHLTIVPPIS